MPNIFKTENYREFLAQICEAAHPQRGFQAQLAKACGCQASYLSQVLRQKVHLTEDQALGLSQHLQFSNLETEYFLLLIRYAKAGTQNLQKFLKKSLEQMQRAQFDLSQRVNADQGSYSNEQIGEYANSWLPSVVHLLTGISEFQTIEAISTRLRISMRKTKEVLSLLQKMGFVAYEDGRWLFKSGNIHIPKDSQWNSSFQNGRRQLAMKSITESTSDAFHFSSVFTIDKETQEHIQKLLSDYVEKSHKIIKNSGNEDVYCMCLDFFIVD